MSIFFTIVNKNISIKHLQRRKKNTLAPPIQKMKRNAFWRFRIGSRVVSFFLLKASSEGSLRKKIFFAQFAKNEIALCIAKSSAYSFREKQIRLFFSPRETGFHHEVIFPPSVGSAKNALAYASAFFWQG